MVSRKVSEQWEFHLIGKRVNCDLLESQKFIKQADMSFSFASSLERILLLPVEFRPVVVVSDNYFIVHKRNSWTRVDRLSFLILLKRIAVDLVNDIANCPRKTYLLAAIVWASKQPSTHDLSIISKVCVDAMHGELLHEKATSMQGFITDWQKA